MGFGEYSKTFLCERKRGGASREGRSMIQALMVMKLRVGETVPELYIMLLHNAQLRSPAILINN